MSTAQNAWAVILLVSTFTAFMSAALMIGSVYEGDGLGARFWGVVFFGSSLAAALSFWELT